MRLEAVEFLRRFLLHVLPKGFPKVRSYGFLANRSCKLERCRELLGAAVQDEPSLALPDPRDELILRCPNCGGSDIVRRDVPAALRASPTWRLDSS